MYVEIPKVETQRLILRSLGDADIDPLHHVFCGEGVLRYFPRSDPPSREQVKKMIAGQIEHWEKHGYGWWAVDCRARNRLIGWCGLQYLPGTDEIEVAYLLAQPFWGQGLATEAARAALRFGFEDLGLDRIVAIVHPENAASRRVAAKLGMSFVECAEYFGMDCCRYQMSRPGR